MFTYINNVYGLFALIFTNRYLHPNYFEKVPTIYRGFSRERNEKRCVNNVVIPRDIKFMLNENFPLHVSNLVDSMYVVQFLL